MKRRSFFATVLAGVVGLVASPSLGAQAAVVDDSLVDRYWDAQWQILEYEQERAEMVAHRQATEWYRQRAGA